MPPAATSSEMINFLFIQPLRGRRRWLIYLAMVALFVPAYFYLGGQLLRQTNMDIMASDQLANIWLARESKEDTFPLRSSYIQPLWPWVSTFVLDKDDNTYFLRGRQLNLAIGCAATLLIFVIGAALVAPVPGYMMGLVAGCAVFLQRAHYFHPEPLLYSFFAVATLLMVLSLHCNRWWFHLGWGICFGLAYLAKASVSPLLAVYFGATVVLLLGRSGWLPAWIIHDRTTEADWSVGRHIAGICLGLFFAAAIIAPNAIFKQRVHGDAFFSPTKYWMWCDDWDTEAYPLYERVWTTSARAAFPPGDLPTMKNYLRKHGFAHAGQRLVKGMDFMSGRFVLPARKLVPAIFVLTQHGNTERGEPDRIWRFVMPARGLYLVLLGLLVVFLWIDRRRNDVSSLFCKPSGLAACAFMVALALIYWFAFGWYAVIGRGERFSLMLYLPFLFALVTSGWLLSRATPRTTPKIVFVTGISVVLVHALIQVLRLLALPQFSRALS